MLVKVDTGTKRMSAVGSGYMHEIVRNENSKRSENFLAHADQIEVNWLWNVGE